MNVSVEWYVYPRDANTMIEKTEHIANKYGQLYND